ncbi:hypothetical protein CMUS01_06211 [Colletotrichum musicola]|uniref:Uncharacterized protein n=1 Tax=Colletotrichum musicola TaxID=2175873 RepID=A0A8H6KMX7_9PEZI|nr:hypothetical protein CMUS01_06211 [Colletotrichum musicola]
MAALARPLGLRLSLPAAAARSPLRLFTTSSRLGYAAPKTKNPSSSSSTMPKDLASKIVKLTTAQAKSKPPTPREELIRKLAAKGTPTTLYESASHFWMKTSAWAACLMFYGYAGINYYFTILHPPPELATWVGPAWAVICAATAGFGSYFLAAVFGIVRSVRAVPTASIAKNLLPAAARADLTPVHLEFTVKRLLPGKAKKIIVAPGRVTLPYSIFAAARAPAVASKQSAKSLREKKAEWEYDKNHLMTVPFRHAGQGMKAAWYGIQRALTRSGFVKVKAGDSNLKLDVHSGWALEDGRVLDQLCKVSGPGAAKK